MALTYAQLDALTTNEGFLGRVREAVAFHANYQLNNQAASPQSKQWAATVFISGGGAGRCAQMAANMARQLVQDPNVKSASSADASDLTDAAVQGAVDVICEQYV